MLRTLWKKFAGIVIKPLIGRYLKKHRTYRWKQITVEVPPGVFHPGLFFSTRFLLEHLQEINLKDLKFLELGAGSGLISVYAAGKGAKVTATDINPAAVNAVAGNAEKNRVGIQVIQSDLFQQLPSASFDLVVINPPYYRGNPADIPGHAWYAGDDLQYFRKLFKDLNNVIHPGSIVMMVLSDDCPINDIREIAVSSGFNMQLLRKKKILFEWNFIFGIVTGGNSPEPLPS